MDLEKLVLPLEIADKAFNVGVGAAVAGVTALVGAMGLAIKSTFDWAGELDSIQDIIGATNKEAAAFNFTLRKSGTSTETFNSSLTIMSKGLVKADGQLDTIGKSLASWGINVKNSNGGLKTQSQLIGDISQKYNSFATQQERVNFLTEVFGRGGAQMIDFFDTLATDGGIDAVTQKVEKMGLVIDPGRYEQFTRNLEEIKLAGLGLAVSFTEKLMPVFEQLMTTAMPKIREFGDYVLTNLPIWSDKFFTFINNAKTWYDTVFTPAVDNAKLSVISFAAGVDILRTAQENGTDVSYKYSDSIDELAAISFANAIGLGESVKNVFNDILTIMGLMTGQTDQQNMKFSILRGLFAGFTSVALTVSMHIENLRKGFEFLDARLQDVINHWSQLVQVAQFIGNNAFGTPNNPQPFGSPNRTANTPRGGRASGGPVIGGQLYNVTRMFESEQFRPAVNGRIDPIQPMQQQVINEDSLAEKIGFYVGIQVAKAI